MLREISEIESIGDSCYNMARTIRRKQEAKAEFVALQSEHIDRMFVLTDDALTQMNRILKGPKENYSMDVSFNLENEINHLRSQLRTQNIVDVEHNLYTYSVGSLYMDIIQECEKLGDYVVNVVEARYGVRQSD